MRNRVYFSLISIADHDYLKWILVNWVTIIYSQAVLLLSKYWQVCEFFRYKLVLICFFETIYALSNKRLVPIEVSLYHFYPQLTVNIALCTCIWFVNTLAPDSKMLCLMIL